MNGSKRSSRSALSWELVAAIGLINPGEHIQSRTKKLQRRVSDDLVNFLRDPHWNHRHTSPDKEGHARTKRDDPGQRGTGQIRRNPEAQTLTPYVDAHGRGMSHPVAKNRGYSSSNLATMTPGRRS